MDFQRKDRIQGLLVLLSIPVCAILIGLWTTRPRPSIIQGEIEARQIDVAAKIPGRLNELLVVEGTKVSKGQRLASLESPEILAKVQQAKGAGIAAKAQWTKAQNGSREEEILQARELWQATEADARLAQRTSQRIERLFQEGIVAAQKRDEIQALNNKAQSAAMAARSRWEMTVKGARQEDKEAARGIASQAEGAINEVESYLSETQLISPIDAEVVECLAEPGEIIPAGYPIITLIDLSDFWAIFNLREDRLKGIKIGDTIEADIPALELKNIVFNITYISVMADFATWRSTNEQGDFDLKTFEVRARPFQVLQGLRPGMSVIWRSKS